MRSVSQRLQRLQRLVRRRSAALLLIGSVAWVAASLVVASNHGAHRRRTFNAPDESTRSTSGRTNR